ncbi:hypothetical protein, partial [Stenotrophomonas sp. BIIR7]|uniref:hypothetical protein n=1 Tax=Stenotrophomonas sp. BIIR7 TaxID=1904462 RepID=UPI001C404E60
PIVRRCPWETRVPAFARQECRFRMETANTHGVSLRGLHVLIDSNFAAFDRFCDAFRMATMAFATGIGCVN